MARLKSTPDSEQLALSIVKGTSFLRQKWLLGLGMLFG